MARKGYSTEFDAEETAVARGVDVHCSPKASRNIMKAIKGMRLEEAKDYLTGVVEKERAVPMVVRKRKIKHRRGHLGPGAFPVKAAGRVLRVLENAENNAEYKDLEADNLRILHASAYRGETIVKYKPRAQGRATARFEQTTNMEIVLGEDERLDELSEAKEERRGRGAVRPRSGKTKPKRQTVTQAAREQEEGKDEDKKGAVEEDKPAPKTGGDDEDAGRAKEAQDVPAGEGTPSDEEPEGPGKKDKEAE